MNDITYERMCTISFQLDIIFNIEGLNWTSRANSNAAFFINRPSTGYPSCTATGILESPAAIFSATVDRNDKLDVH